jgi:protocatechuate 3,4-dioxygenase beta subunit
MTKSVLITLVLASLAFVILRFWFFDRPATDPAGLGTGHEQSQVTAGNPDGFSPQRALDVAVKSPAISPDSPATRTGSSTKPTVSASGSAELTPLDRITSAFPDDEQPEGLAISGIVQDEDGHPLANIEVVADPMRFFNVDEEEIDPALKEARSAFTDYEGYYTLAGLIDGEYRVYTVAMAGLASAKITARAGATSVNLIPAWLREIQVSGFVKSTDGSPLEAVRVTSGSPIAKTDSGPDGFYQITASVKVSVEKHAVNFKLEGFRNQKMSLDSVDLDGTFTDISLDVTMEPLVGLTTVTGRLKDPDGQPVALQVVYLRSRKLRSSYSAYSDQNGMFTVENVESGTDYNLLIPPKTNFRDYERNQLEIPKSGLDLQIVLEPLVSGEFSGWLIDTEGNQVSGYSLTVHHEQSIQQSSLVTSDHEGYFMVDEYPEGPVRLGREAAPRFAITGIRASSKAQEPVLVVLDLGRHVIQGLVTNRRGEPVVSPEVILTWVHREKTVQSDSWRGTATGANGSFEFAGIGVGQHTLQVKAPGFRAAVIEIDVGMDPTNIVVELEEDS